jgi:hypothetical protein
MIWSTFAVHFREFTSFAAPCCSLGIELVFGVTFPDVSFEWFDTGPRPV